MMRKHDPPPGRDRLPAMFVGDEEPLPRPLLPELARETAAMLPRDLQVTVEDSTAKRLPLIAAALLAVLLGLGVVNAAADPDAYPLDLLTEYGVFAAGCAGVAWLAYRQLARRRRKYRLSDEGIVLQVWRGSDPRPWITEIPWTEIADYTASIDAGTLYLRVESVRGYTLSLQDRPPRLSTREFIRRFIEQAERHPRAVRMHSGAVDETENVSIATIVVCGVLIIAGVAARDRFDFSFGQQLAGFAIIGVAAFGLYLWHTLDDHDAVHGDRTSRRLIARLRRWLRKVLGIDVI